MKGAAWLAALAAGDGTLRVLPNSRKKSAYPYVVRVRTHDRKDLTGPRGLVCPPAPKGY